MPKVPWAALAYPAAGAAAGAMVGFVVASPARAFDVAAPWVGGLVAVGLVAGGAALGVRAWNRRPRRVRASPVAPAAAPAVAVALDLPAIAQGFPDVWGAGEALEVAVRAPPEAVVSLTTVPPVTVESVAPGRFRVKAAEGEVVLVASAVGKDGAVGEARRSVAFVRYAREIQTMVDDFRTWAEANVEGARHALTPRELMETIVPRVPPEGARALLVLARAYEIVTYGERPADRALYVEVVRAFGTLESTGLFDRRAAGAVEAT